MRTIGDTAVDPQTGWTWVCLGDHSNHGPHWSCYTARGEQYSSREPDRAEVRAHGSLERALAAGVTPAGGLALAPYKRLAKVVRRTRWMNQSEALAIEAALADLPEG